MIGSILLGLVCFYLIALAVAGPSLPAAIAFSAAVIAVVAGHHANQSHRGS